MVLALMRMDVFRYLMVADLVRSSLHVDIRKKYIFYFLVKAQRKGYMILNWLQKKEYAIHFREQHKKICLSLNSYLLTVMN